ncbi:hypothetical protein BZA05DRAFT_388237 [Tricharina praecox]|uniref:uncharacterized protein n=1 Tax=Tricharina praecox TaxID=43433 RepID=UPI00221F3680|nr:uncharacterized protein BZA05DRAFT_388237 [Tricharina praecox]KAI5856361.1 hypothetical protein BZA05DRAFT_388237 [Tricharina praecox]
MPLHSRHTSLISFHYHPPHFCTPDPTTFYYPTPLPRKRLSSRTTSSPSPSLVPSPSSCCQPPNFSTTPQPPLPESMAATIIPTCYLHAAVQSSLSHRRPQSICSRIQHHGTRRRYSQVPPRRLGLLALLVAALTDEDCSNSADHTASPVQEIGLPKSHNGSEQDMEAVVEMKQIMEEVEEMEEMKKMVEVHMSEEVEAMEEMEEVEAFEVKRGILGRR